MDFFNKIKSKKEKLELKSGGWANHLDSWGIPGREGSKDEDPQWDSVYRKATV